MAEKRITFLVRLHKREASMLALAAKAYRAPSRNWFVGEMITCMLNPARWAEFNSRLVSGSEQLTLMMGEEAQAQARALLRSATPASRASRAKPKKRGPRRVRT